MCMYHSTTTRCLRASVLLDTEQKRWRKKTRERGKRKRGRTHTSIQANRLLGRDATRGKGQELRSKSSEKRASMRRRRQAFLSEPRQSTPLVISRCSERVERKTNSLHCVQEENLLLIDESTHTHIQLNNKQHLAQTHEPSVSAE